MRQHRVDPVGLEVFGYHYAAIAEEMSTALRCTAFDDCIDDDDCGSEQLEVSRLRVTTGDAGVETISLQRSRNIEATML